MISTYNVKFSIIYLILFKNVCRIVTERIFYISKVNFKKISHKISTKLSITLYGIAINDGFGVFIYTYIYILVLLPTLQKSEISRIRIFLDRL